MKPIDFLAIGDVVVDAFIELHQASVHCNINNSNCEICMPFCRKNPYEFVEEIAGVGSGPNAAVSAARLGLRSAMMTNVGSDENANKCISAFKKMGFRQNTSRDTRVSKQTITTCFGTKTKELFL